MRVLVADTDQETRQCIRLIVEDILRVSNTYEAADGKKALNVIKNNYINIVITNVKIPGIDGLELARRGMEYNSNLVFIMISADEEIEYIREAIKIGVCGYIVKPITRCELDETIKRAIVRIEENRIRGVFYRICN